MGISKNIHKMLKRIKPTFILASAFYKAAALNLETF